MQLLKARTQAYIEQLHQESENSVIQRIAALSATSPSARRCVRVCAHDAYLTKIASSPQDGQSGLDWFCAPVCKNTSCVGYGSVRHNWLCSQVGPCGYVCKHAYMQHFCQVKSCTPAGLTLVLIISLMLAMSCEQEICPDANRERTHSALTVHMTQPAFVPVVHATYSAYDTASAFVPVVHVTEPCMPTKHAHPLGPATAPTRPYLYGDIFAGWTYQVLAKLPSLHS